MITSIWPIAPIMISGVEQEDDAELVERQELRLEEADRETEEDDHHRDAGLAAAEEEAERVHAAASCRALRHGGAA